MIAICNLCAVLFILIYPFAAIALHKNRPRYNSHANIVSRFMLVVQYAVMYLLSVGVLIHYMYFSKYVMHFMNRSIKFYRQCEWLNEDKMHLGKFMYPFILRGIVSYFGYALLNYLSLVYFFGDLSRINLVYKIVYFAPYIVITTMTIHFHAGVVQLTISGRRINQAFSTCIESINVAHDKPSDEFEQICALAMKRFNYLTLHHVEWYEIARMLEKKLSLLMLFTVVNSTYNLTQTVF